MRVHSDTIKSVRWHKIVPEAQRLECIMYDSEYVALLVGTKGEPLHKYIQRIVTVTTGQRLGKSIYRMLP